MSTPKPSAALAIWRGRQVHNKNDNAYALYICLLFATIVAFPIVRAVWMFVNRPHVIAALASPDAPAIASLGIAVIWAGALFLGNKRGPAVLPPFLLYALLNSGIPRAASLRRPAIVSAVTTIVTIVSGTLLAGIALFNHGIGSSWGLILPLTAAISTGLVTTTLALCGQAFSHLSASLAFTLLTVAGISSTMPSSLAFTPWGWAGASLLPTALHAIPLAAVTLLAILCMTITPALLNRIPATQLELQAARWEHATALSFTFDFDAAVSVYSTTPHMGRRIRAVRPHKRLCVTFFVRDFIGQIRTPGRMIGAVITAIFASVLITFSMTPGMHSVLSAVAAGCALYAASGPLTTGLQHAVSIAGNYTLYGVSDRQLVLLHSTFPVTTLLAILGFTATITAFTVDTGVGFVLCGSLSAGLLILALRFSRSLKGSLPPSFLTPIATPMGDLSIFMHFGWAFSDLGLAILGVLTITLLPTTTIPLACVAVLTAALLWTRWRKRR